MMVGVALPELPEEQVSVPGAVGLELEQSHSVLTSAQVPERDRESIVT